MHATLLSSIRIICTAVLDFGEIRVQKCACNAAGGVLLLWGKIRGKEVRYFVTDVNKVKLLFICEVSHPVFNSDSNHTVTGSTTSLCVFYLLKLRTLPNIKCSK